MKLDKPGVMAGVIIIDAEQTWKFFVAMQCAGINLGDDPQNCVKVIALVIDDQLPAMFPKPILDYLRSLYDAQRKQFEAKMVMALDNCEIDMGAHEKVAKMVENIFQPSIYNMVTTYGFHRRLWAIRN